MKRGEDGEGMERGGNEERRGWIGEGGGMERGRDGGEGAVMEGGMEKGG